MTIAVPDHGGPDRQAGWRAAASVAVLIGLVAGGGYGALEGQDGRDDRDAGAGRLLPPARLAWRPADCGGGGGRAVGLWHRARRRRAHPGRQSCGTGAGRLQQTITFTGSVIAWGKLSGHQQVPALQGAPVVFKSQHALNAVLGLAALFFVFGFWHSQTSMDFWLIAARLRARARRDASSPSAGPTMPVVVSMLNSYSGWAAAASASRSNNPMLIIAGSLVARPAPSSATSWCKAMNRAFLNVILGGFGGGTSTAAGATQQRSVRGKRQCRRCGLRAGRCRDGGHRAGLWPAVACAQHAVRSRRRSSPKGITVSARFTRGRPHAGPHERPAGRGRGAV